MVGRAFQLIFAFYPSTRPVELVFARTRSDDDGGLGGS